MKTASLLFLIATGALFAAEPQFSEVFVRDRDGYPAYRIPAVVVSKKGTVLAFAEARQKLADQAQNDIVLKRSTDGGATWGVLRVVHEDGANSLNNPTALVAESGRIFLMYQRIPAHLTEHSKDQIVTGYDGPDVYRTLLVTSDDDGETWSEPADVTPGTKRPTVATTIATGPGIGLQLTRGPHKGRLIMPFNEGPYGIWNNYAAFSDDQGATWRSGENVPGALLGSRSQINEVQMVELSDGSVRLNSRQFAGAKVRKTSISRDGGTTWSAVEEVPALRDPSCMASILRYSFDDAAGQGRILYSGPDSTRRDTGTIYLSTDDGATWPVKKELYPGGFAYSVLTRLADGQVGCLFEADNYRRLIFARFPVEWISEPLDAESIKPVGRTERTGKFANWMTQHEQKLAMTKAGELDLVFLGDSITQQWATAGKAAWEQYYAARRAGNYGIGGDSTQHILWRLDQGEFDGLAPKVCVLLIGTNNAKHSTDTPEEIAMGVRAILMRLAEKAPHTKVLLLAILPRGAEPSDPLRQRTQRINLDLAAFADGKRIHFLDIGPRLLTPDGLLTKELAPDLLHLSAAGYAIWAEAMEPKLKELLGEK